MKTILLLLVITLISCNYNKTANKTLLSSEEHLVTEGLDAMPAQPTAIALEAPTKLGLEEEKSQEIVGEKIVHKKPQRSLETLKTLIQGLDSTSTNYQLYEEYGDALLASSAYDKAFIAYKKSEVAGNKNLKGLYFKMARAKGFKGKNPYNRLNMAVMEGYNNYRSILYDPAFKKFRKSKGEIAHFFSMFFGDNSKALFKILKVLVPKDKLSKPYTITAKELLGTNETEYYSIEETRYKSKKWRLMGDYGFLEKELEKASFTRSLQGHQHCNLYVDRFKDYDILICSSDGWADYVHPTSYYLITCDKQGKKIDALKIAKKGSMKTCQTATLNPDGSIVVTTNAIAFKKKSIREKTEEYVSLNHNDLASIEVMHEETYQIQANGKIVNTEGLLLGMK